MGRSIWDMPATAVAAPPTPNPSLTREQQEHQLLHQQQQHLLLQQQQQNEVEKLSRRGWDQTGPGLVEEKLQQNHIEYENKNNEAQQSWPSQEQETSLLASQNSELTGPEYNNQPSLSTAASVQPIPLDYENDSQNKPRNISSIDTFRTETLNDNIDSNLNKNDFITSSISNSVPKLKEKKDKRDKLKKEGKKHEKVTSNNNNQQELVSSDNYIPGMEGAVKPEVPITATKSMEEEQQQRAQADALYRLQVTFRFQFQKIVFP